MTHRKELIVERSICVNVTHELRTPLANVIRI
jgi:signal transduction histidine kinase